MLPAGAGANGWEHTALPPEVLIRALAAPVVAVRQQAAHSLGYHPREEVVNALMGRLEDGEPDTSVRQAIFHSLGKVGDARALDSIARCLDGEVRVSVRAACGEALGGIGDDRALGLAGEALADPEAPVRLAAIRSLGGFRTGTAVVVLLDHGGKHPEHLAAVIDALGRTGQDGALVGVLPHLVPGSPPAILASALKAVSRLGGGDVAARAVERVHVAVEDPAIRRLSLVALAASGSESAGAGLRRALADGDPLTRIQALQIIREGGDSAMLPFLLEAGLDEAGRLYRRSDADIDRDTATVIVELAVINEILRTVIALDAAGGEALYRVVAGPPVVPRNRPDLLKVAEGFYRARWQGMYGLGYARSDFLHAILEAGAADPDHRIRSVALRSMGVHGAEEFRPALLTALDDPHHEVRRQAAMVLGRDAGLADVTPLLVLLEDPDARVRLEASRSLGYLGNPAARQRLRRAAAEDTDQRVRQTAAFSLDMLSD